MVHKVGKMFFPAFKAVAHAIGVHLTRRRQNMKKAVFLLSIILYAFSASHTKAAMLVSSFSTPTPAGTIYLGNTQDPCSVQAGVTTINGVIEKGDLTGDSYVDFRDLSVITRNWLMSYPRADIAPLNGNGSVSISDGDGIVDIRDIAFLARNWLGESWLLSSSALDFLYSQILATENSESLDAYPYCTESNYSEWNNSHHKCNPDGPEPWTVGFFPGCLWYMYELTGDDSIKDKAMIWTERLENQQYNDVFSDQAFVFLPSYRNGYRLGGSDCKDYDQVVLQAAASLAGLYSPIVGCLRSRSWGDWKSPTKFTVVVDTMMNLEILFWASKNGGDPQWYDIAVSHAYRTIKEFVRENGSTCNIVIFYPDTGEVNYKVCDPNAVWSRGQAWAAHAFAIAYRETGDPNFLETAKKTADYFLQNLPSDKVPPVFFGRESQKDSSASAILASGLLELCALVSDPFSRERYYFAAKEILTSLSTSHMDGGFLADASDACILRQSNGYNEGFIYGDYYFVQAMLRYYDITVFEDYPAVAGRTMNVQLTINNTWMYQSIMSQANSKLTATASIAEDPLGNTGYTYEWQFILPDDVTIPPTITDGGTLSDPCCTFAAPSCNEPNGLSDSGQAFTVRVTVTGNDFGNTGIAEAEFGIALLGDVNNDKAVNATDRSIINAFWRLGAAGSHTFTDCNLNCDTDVNGTDRSIANAVWRGVLGQYSVNAPCPFR